MVFLVLCDFFGQIHSTSLNFSLQIGLCAKKHLVFVFVSIQMTMSYMSLEIFSFEWIQILNGTKVWQYHRLSHHKIWATSIHIWFLEFHTSAHPGTPMRDICDIFVIFVICDMCDMCWRESLKRWLKKKKMKKERKSRS